MCRWFTFLFLVASSSDASEVHSFGTITNLTYHLEMKSFLLSVSNRLSSENPTFQSPLWSRSDSGQGFVDFDESYFMNYTNDHPIWIKLHGGVNENQFGNHLGEFMKDYACAEFIGAHLILLMPPHYAHREYPIFDQSLPKIIVHESPSTLQESLSRLKSGACGSFNHGWLTPPGPALDNSLKTKTLPHILHHSLSTAGIAALKGQQTFYQPSQSSKNSITINYTFPIVSDVALHYRCSDNINFPGMGLLPFPTIVSLIPTSARYIYIHTEGRSHVTVRSHESLCPTVMDHLLEAISNAFPEAYVVIRTSGIYETMFDFIASYKALICSSSTFCTHAAIGKLHGEVYLPRVWYAGQLTGGPNWHLIDQLPRTKWPDVMEERSIEVIVACLSNLTLYNDYEPDKRSLRHRRARH
jgi:hypothetical protein